ncbi:fumarylacetoacetate (FAA) hydrolase family protein [Burkholderia cenocepacia]|uniref:Fumarylacetoacetate (FAA) hydrolase family protein n=1 Tax=Burkholderia cenocepacia TaxID=95486 RepID=A0AAN0S012_9BURK|nr:fumarylacetoacetate (FAA) hydrolase family protein [Burkholderia cenocepacia]
MTEFVFPAPEQPSLAVIGSDACFPIRRVFCVGRNYAAHAREMGNDPDREPPFFFMKPADAIVPANRTIQYPSLTSNLHHEVEMVIAIGRTGSNIDSGLALDYVWGYGVGIDLTRRDIQDVAKKMGRPWDWAKGFDSSGPCGALVPASSIGHPSTGNIWLNVNGTVRQNGNLDEMIWSVAEIVAAISMSVTIAPGDLIFSGTPAGVSALQPGDVVTAGIEGIGEIFFEVAGTD